jgi:hypothetical protein
MKVSKKSDVTKSPRGNRGIFFARIGCLVSGHAFKTPRAALISFQHGLKVGDL